MSGDRLNAHLQLARQHGLDLEALTTLVTLLAVYIGYARASPAMETVQGLLGSDDQATVHGKLAPAQ